MLKFITKVDVDVSVVNAEAMPWMILSKRHTAYCVCLFFGYFIIVYYFACSRQCGEKQCAPYWRAAFFPVSFTCGYIFVPEIWGPALTGKSCLSKVFKLSGAAFFTLLNVVVYFKPIYNQYYLSGFVASSFLVVIYTMVTLPVHWLLTKTAKPPPFQKQVMWALIVLSCTLGVYNVYYMLSVSYILIVASGHPYVAALFLSAGVDAAERLAVIGLSRGYRLIVSHSRNLEGVSRSLQEPVRGDQRSVVLSSVAVIHGFAECCRLVSLFAATARDPSFGSWLPTIVLSLISKTLWRKGWSSWIAAQVLPAKLANLASPNVISHLLHKDMAFTMGYPRFVVPVALIVGRAASGATKTPSYINMHIIGALLGTVLGEVIEDIVDALDVVPHAKLSRKQVAVCHTRWLPHKSYYS